MLSFDQAVIINAFNFFGVGGNETVTVTVSSLADAFSFESSGGSDNNVDPFGEGFELAAGETISFGSVVDSEGCLLYTSPSPRDLSTSRMPSSA